MPPAAPQLGPLDVEVVLVERGDVVEHIVLVGGQAVNFWAERYSESDSALREKAPFTSKDIDFQGDADAVRTCAERLEGKPVACQASMITRSTWASFNSGTVMGRPGKSISFNTR